MEKAIEIRSQCKHFRILIIGRSNAGKTTILKKVCNTIEEPMIFSPSGEKIDASVVDPSGERGEHNIDNQLIFKSNPEFIFHDSRGFEAGTVDELELVKKFIRDRANTKALSDQLHAIWYCISTDNDRPILAADEIFFDECDSGKVPVIIIFTKFDALITTARGALREENHQIKLKELKHLAPVRAEEKLNKIISLLKDRNYFRGNYVRLQDMDKEATTCSELIERTADAIDDDALKLLFVTVQTNNLDLCIKYAVFE